MQPRHHSRTVAVVVVGVRAVASATCVERTSIKPTTAGAGFIELINAATMPGAGGLATKATATAGGGGLTVL